MRTQHCAAWCLCPVRTNYGAFLWERLWKLRRNLCYKTIPTCLQDLTAKSIFRSLSLSKKRTLLRRHLWVSNSPREYRQNFHRFKRELCFVLKKQINKKAEEKMTSWFQVSRKVSSGWTPFWNSHFSQRRYRPPVLRPKHYSLFAQIHVRCMARFQALLHTPSIAFWHLPPRKDVVNQCLEFYPGWRLTANSKQRFTTSFLGGRYWKAVLGVWIDRCPPPPSPLTSLPSQPPSPAPTPPDLMIHL